MVVSPMPIMLVISRRWRELDYGWSYRLGQPQDMLEMGAFSEWRTRVASIANGTEQRLGFRFKLRL